MSKDFVLCKLALVDSSDSEQCSDETEYIKYKMKSFKLPNGFEMEHKTFQQIVDEYKTLRFACIYEYKSELILAYRASFNGCGGYVHDKILAEKLFKILFEGYSKVSVQLSGQNAGANDSGNKMPWTYATLKLYEILQTKHNHIENTTKDSYTKSDLLLPNNFLPTLCEYQKRTVRWLLYKEQQVQILPPFFIKLQNKYDGTIVYRHMHAMYMTTLPPDSIVLPAGGILAEEMGLGKTVEMLALILLHARPDNDFHSQMEMLLLKIMSKRKHSDNRIFCICSSNSDKDIISCQKCNLWQHKTCVHQYDPVSNRLLTDSSYICPSCWCTFMVEHKSLIETKATFIVTPNIIKLQWLSEMKRHIKPNLRVCLYNGISSGKWISPIQLAEYDVVLTDFNTLRNDIHYTGGNESDRVSRHRPRRMRMRTPLLMLNWWRVCLDEAQMIGVSSNVFTLVRMLPAVNRWVITGTPIQKSLNDLQPLLKFIGFEEAAERCTWNHLVQNFISQSENETNLQNLELVNILQKCMRRTNKQQVNQEINIPEQNIIVHRIEFNNLEKFVYRDVYNAQREEFLSQILKFKLSMTNHSPEIMNSILQPFIKVRQSCTMPCVECHSTSPVQKQLLHLNELHEYLKTSNENDCKSVLRCIASSHNGLAALFFLQKQYDISLKHYQAVLRLAKDYKEINVSVDSLLQIHALHNLIEIHSIKDENIPQIASEQLKAYEEQCNTLEWKYLHTYADTVAGVRQSYETVLNNMQTNSIDDLLIYFVDHLNNLNTTRDAMLMEKITDDCVARFGLSYPKLKNIVSTKSLLYTLETWWQNVLTLFQKIVQSFNNLQYFIDNIKIRNQVDAEVWENSMDLVKSVYNCHLHEFRQSDSVKKTLKTANLKNRCIMCNLRDAINKFECALYLKVITVNRNATDGFDHASFEFILIKSVCAFLKMKCNQTMYLPPDHSRYIDRILKYFENSQLLCKHAIKYWIEIEFAIKAYDELDMCKMRISLTENKEEVSNFNILASSIDQRIVELQQELCNAEIKFSNKLARLKYIRHLEKNADIDLCPICRLNDSDQYVALKCGHHICLPCMKRLLAYSDDEFIQCSVCRHTQFIKDVLYVSRSLSKQQQSSDIEINGNYTAKIAYIVRLILKLRKENKLTAEAATTFATTQQLKIVIFTKWEKILIAIATALKNNHINCREKCTAKNIEEFKNPLFDVTCLLMLYSKGAQGLNLIEATHVFLVEPIMNPGEEMQAIGRVHRFGQTKTTTVHYFIVNGTIEENIYNYLKSIKAQDSSCVHLNWEVNYTPLEAVENIFEYTYI